MNENEIKAIDVVNNFLDHEIEDYSYYNDGRKITESEDCEGYVYVCWQSDKVSGKFRIKIEELKKLNGSDNVGNIEIEVCIDEEDRYEATKWCDWTVKYFWMALLNEEMTR